MAESSQSSADEDTASSAGSPSPPKKVQSAKAMEPKAQTHPRTSEMVMQAVKELGERGGSSLFAIKKYINLTYKVDTEKQAHFIKKYLKAAVASGELVQTKGNGANGSFKLSAKAQAAKRKEAKLVEAETAAAEKVPPAKKAAEKKTSKTESAKPSTKKPAPSKVTKKESSASAEKAKTAKSALPKSPKTKGALPKSPKAKKQAKSPTAKPKAPKPKKVGAGAKSPKAATASKKRTAVKKQ